jgi:hypothetical protein
MTTVQHTELMTTVQHTALMTTVQHAPCTRKFVTAINKHNSETIPNKICTRKLPGRLFKNHFILPFTHDFFVKLIHQNYVLFPFCFLSTTSRVRLESSFSYLLCIVYRPLLQAKPVSQPASHTTNQRLGRPVYSVHIPIKVCSLRTTQYSLLSNTFTTARFPSPAQHFYAY